MTEQNQNLQQEINEGYGAVKMLVEQPKKGKTAKVIAGFVLLVLGAAGAAKVLFDKFGKGKASSLPEQGETIVEAVSDVE